MTMNKEQLKILYEKLPEAVKQVYDRPETNDDIYEIGHKYKLHIDQIGVVIKNAYGVMLGITKPSDFVTTIVKEAGLAEDIANLITHEINEQVFAPIRQELMKTGGDWPINNGPKPLPKNVETTTHFSSAPYQPDRPDDPAKQEILTAIENPSPTPMITRDNFADKLGQLSQTKDLPPEQVNSNPTPATAEKKPDPYREAIH